jgi:hypothetical protein
VVAGGIGLAGFRDRSGGELRIQAIRVDLICRGHGLFFRLDGSMRKCGGFGAALILMEIELKIVRDWQRRREESRRGTHECMRHGLLAEAALSMLD